jgi:hypothetical protein
MKIIRFLKYSILLLPLWWLLGLISIIFHVIVLFIFFILLVKKKIVIPKQTIFLFLFICVYILSVIINYEEIPFDRLLATLYNLSYWILGLLLIIVIYNSYIDFRQILNLSKSFVILGTGCGLLSLLGIILFFNGYYRLTITTPVGDILLPFFRNAPMITSSFCFSLLFKDYTGFGVLPRGSLFFGWPTALGMTMGITIPITIFYYKVKNKIFNALPHLFSQIIGLFFSLSRIVVVGLFISYFLVYYLTTKKLKRIIILNFIIFGFLLIFLLQIHSKLMLKVEEFRKGSSKTRINLYSWIIKTTLSEKPFFGFGFKPREENIDIPLASHSTYFSNLFKSGVVGLSLLILFWFSIYKKWYSQMKLIIEKKFLLLHNFIGLIFFQGLIWQLTEDIDATLIVPFLYFIIVGLIISFEKIKVDI